MLTDILCPFHSVKDLGKSAQSADGRLHLHTHTPLAQRSRTGLTTQSRHSLGTCEGNKLTRNSPGNISSQSSQLAEPLWTESGLKSGIGVRELSPHWGGWGGHHYHHACTHLYGHRNGTKGRNNWNNRSVFGSRGWTKLGTAPLRRVRYFHHTQARWGKKMLVEHQKARNMAGASVSHIEWVHNYNFTCIPEPPFLFLSLSYLPPLLSPLPPLPNNSCLSPRFLLRMLVNTTSC